MKVGRIYEIDVRWHSIQRLWALETVFSATPSEEGRQKTLRRLRRHRDDVTKVIDELQQELESESWLE